jgi:hypothetical protein
MSTIKKHSKYKNTGILFELLVRQVTSDMMTNQDSKAVSIIKKFFKGTEMSKEYGLYNTIINAPKLSEGKAESLINVVLEQGKKLQRDKLNKEKYNLIREIKKHYEVENFFKAKVDNYKLSAAIYNLIESTNDRNYTDTKTIVVNKLTILEHVTKELMTESKIEKKAVEEFMKEDKDIRILAYKILVEKFNTQYNVLSDDQKLILKEYINNISDTKQLKVFLNNKISEVRYEIENLIPKIEDKVTTIKLNEVLTLIKPISERQSIKEDNLVSLMQYYELVKEIKSVK